jgi:GH24 family phage-related lysozyme (muramidase)
VRPIPDIAVDFIAAHEGKRLTAYLDAAAPPVLTIGYGHTGGVKAGQKITDAQAKAFLKTDLLTAAGRISDRIGTVVDELTEHQWAALLSFVFNLGADPKWTIWKRLRDRKFDQIPGEMIKFVSAGGNKLQGLVNRRADEIKLWSTDEPGSLPESPPSSETRAVETPPTPSDPTPPAKSPTLIGGALGVATTVTVAANSITNTVSPYKDASPWIGQAIAILATVAAAAAVIVLALNWLRKREARG